MRGIAEWRLDREIAKAVIPPLADVGIGDSQRLADRLCIQVYGQQAAIVAGFGLHLRNCGIHNLAACRSHGPKTPPAGTCASLLNYRRWVARRSGQPCAYWHAPTASGGLCNRRLVGGRSARSGKLVAYDPSVRFQLSLSNGPVQHPLSFWARPRHWFPESDQ